MDVKASISLHVLDSSDLLLLGVTDFGVKAVAIRTFREIPPAKKKGLFIIDLRDANADLWKTREVSRKTAEAFLGRKIDDAFLAQKREEKRRKYGF